MRKALFIIIAGLFIWACGGGADPNSSYENRKPVEKPKDDGKGVGEINNVTLNDPLDQDMVKRGQAIYDMKCAACHKLTAKRVVGPGWAGITKTRKPEWIMNMITNVDMMLAEDPTAQKLLEECLTRMPNQNVSIGDARDILEFIYQNDLDQAAKAKS